MTGGGGLSRKLLTILVLAAMPTLGFAVDNSIFIDQTGDYGNISITQDGSGNKVFGIVNNAPGQATDAAVIKGLGVTLDIQQAGTSNTLALGVDTGKTGNNGTSITYNVSGGNNTGFINLTGGATVNQSNILNIQQTNGDNVTNIALQGKTNNISVTQSGGAASFTSTITGDNNQQSVTTGGGTNNAVSLTQDSNQTATVNFTGGYNAATVKQSDGTHTASITATGSNNTFTVFQQGSSVNNQLGITANGAHNTYVINQNKTP